jgi:hypothetical protein
MRPLFLFLFCLFLVTSSYAQEEGRSAEVDELFKLEAARAATAKSGNKSPVVVVVSDPQKVALIRATMEKNAALKQKQAAAKLATGALWTRYKQKDKSVVPELMAILKGSDKTKRAEVFRGLEKTYRDPADYAITEPELIAQIFQAVNNVEDEKPAVQLAVFNKLPGYEAVFERRLVSGESVDDAKLFFWLGESKSIASLWKSG